MVPFILSIILSEVECNGAVLVFLTSRILQTCVVFPMELLAGYLVFDKGLGYNGGFLVWQFIGLFEEIINYHKDILVPVTSVSFRKLVSDIYCDPLE